jgi:hypothetical protein
VPGDVDAGGAQHVVTDRLALAQDGDHAAVLGGVGHRDDGHRLVAARIERPVAVPAPVATKAVRVSRRSSTPPPSSPEMKSHSCSPTLSWA